MKELQDNILKWADVRGLLIENNEFNQLIQLLEEINELNEELYNDNHTNARMELGDCFVVCTILAKQLGTSIINIMLSGFLTRRYLIYEYVSNAGKKYLSKKLIEKYSKLEESLPRSKDDSLAYLTDVLIVMNVISLMLDSDLELVGNMAYEKIKNRKGKTINGQFEKEE